MARYRISNGDTYTIPDDDLEAIEVMNTTYPDAEVIDTEEEEKNDNGATSSLPLATSPSLIFSSISLIFLFIST